MASDRLWDHSIVYFLTVDVTFSDKYIVAGKIVRVTIIYLEQIDIMTRLHRMIGRIEKRRLSRPFQMGLRRAMGKSRL